MQVFISFASEQRETAELLAVNIRKRGYDVFYSADTLPAAASFDIRIEKAVKTSDLFVFLISPDSVTHGKYTLTELAFAKEKWSNPSGHVLPVMVVPTKIDAIPSYLRVVNILDTDGNIVADTAARVDKLLRNRNLRTAVLLALAGIGTGMLSYLAMRFAGQFLRFSFFSDSETNVTILPGIIFGALVAYGNFWFGLRDKMQLIVIVLFTTIAWVLAANISAASFNVLAQYTKDTSSPYSSSDTATPENNTGAADNSAGGNTASADADSGRTAANSEDANRAIAQQVRQNMPFSGVLVGMLGGLVGGIGTLLGVSIFNQQLRRIEKLLPIAVAAIVLGGILELALMPGWIGALSYPLLFMSWQAVVAGMIARVISGQTDQA